MSTADNEANSEKPDYLYNVCGKVKKKVKKTHSIWGSIWKILIQINM